jgi:hypothetical protein
MKCLRRILVLITVAVAVSTVAMGLRGQNAQSAVPPAPVLVSHHPKMAYSILDQFTLSSQPLGALAEKIQGDIQTCMSGKGWQYWNPTIILYNSEYVNLGKYWSFRVHDGYGVSASIIEESLHRLIPNLSNFRYLARLTKSQLLQYWYDLNGNYSLAANYIPVPLTIPTSSAKGCEAVARRSVLGPLPYFDRNLQRQIGNLYSAEAKNVEVLAAKASWKNCMSVAGYHINFFDQEESHFNQLSNQMNLRSAQKELTPEIVAATADASCFLKFVYPAQSRVDKKLLIGFTLLHPSYAFEISNILSAN